MDQRHSMFVRPEGAPGELGAELMERHGGAMVLEAVARLGLKADDDVIEIGFGPGLALEALARVVTQGHLTGVDPSALMHRRAGARNALAMGQGRLTLVKGLAGALPFANASFDAALAIDNLHFWPDRLAGLRELRRVLRAGAPPPLRLHSAIRRDAGWAHRSVHASRLDRCGTDRQRGRLHRHGAQPRRPERVMGCVIRKK